VLPTVMNLYALGKLMGAPYVPLTPYLLPVPLPRACEIVYGAPMRFDGHGDEDDEQIEALVLQVKERVRELMDKGRAARELDHGGSSSASSSSSSSSGTAT